MKNLCFVSAVIAIVFCFSCETKEQKALKLAKIRLDSVRVADSIKNVKANSLGIWLIGYYVDDFGEKSKDKFISNQPIYGQFSNSATENSDLRVSFLIDKQSFALKLFEYGGKNPVKKGLEWNYDVKIKSSVDNNVTEMEASISDDRLYFSGTDCKKLVTLFSSGGKLQFYIITNSQYSKSQYSFTIEDTIGFANALKKLND